MTSIINTYAHSFPAVRLLERSFAMTCASIPIIYDDPRPILAIWYPGDDAGGYSTDPKWDKSTSKIVAYREHGLSDTTPYYAVYDHQDRIKARVPAHLVTVVYADLPVGAMEMPS